MNDTLTTGELNRAFLARQMLLTRQKITAVKAIERLVGMQAQLARPPYVGLWSRLASFSRRKLTDAVVRKEVVRAPLMRCTLHLFSTRDFCDFRRALQPALDKAARSAIGVRAKKIDLEEVVRETMAFFAETPRTFEAFRDDLARRHPPDDVRAMAFAARTVVPLVQVPVDGMPWGYPGAAAFAPAETWLRRSIDQASNSESLVLRYLAGFGPASPADAQAWSGIPNLKEAFEAARPKLRTFHDDRGRELFDLPRAPRPDPTTPVPVRFIPEYDNLIVGHSDRRRIVREKHRPALYTPNLLTPATFLVDGFVTGIWRITRHKALAALNLSPFVALSKRTREQLTEEGLRLVEFVEPDAAKRTVGFAAVRD
jgi:Winged helix DNA-binding domain